MDMRERPRRSYRSLFWPLLLIGVGLIWLLANMGVIESFSFAFLLRLWPIALIAIGLDLVFGRRSPILGALIGLGVVALVIALLLLAPSLDLYQGPELRTQSFSEPISEATSARIDLDLSRYPTAVNALEDSNALFEAELDSVEGVEFRVEGTSQRRINLGPKTGVSNPFDWINEIMSDARWEIGLNPEVPLDLNVDVGSGSATLDLASLQLEQLDIDGGSGSTRLWLPASEDTYDVGIDGASGSFTIEVGEGAKIDATIRGASGSLNITIEEGANVEAEIRGASGSTTINVPGRTGVRVIVRDSGSGSVHVPGSYTLVSDGGDDDRDTGIWESANYSSATTRIEIEFRGGSGSFSIR